MENYAHLRPQKFDYVLGWIHNWFSNMNISPITINDITYPSVENYYQAMKSTDKVVHLSFSLISPKKSKQEGRRLKIRDNWEMLKENYMMIGLREKFKKPEYRLMLLQTNNEPIIEWNNWHDKEWGVCIFENRGNNKLGKLLMKLREEIRSEIKQYETNNKIGV